MNESLPKLGAESKVVVSPSRPAIVLNNILVPIDFSPASRRGTAFAAGVASGFDSQLHFLYVVEFPALPKWGQVHLRFREEALRRDAENKLSQFTRECGINSSVVRSTTVRVGEADGEICKTAVEQGTDLIVIASHGLGGLKLAFMGSTSEGVVRHAPCPVLTIRDRAFGLEEGEQLTFAPRRILVTTDLSAASKKAFPYALAMARKFRSSITLVYVVPSHLPAEISQIGIVLEEEHIISKAREYLPRFREAELDPQVPVETLVLNGAPAHAICTAAATECADLIVISTHGHTGLKRFALGSVTENVIRHAPCPVLVVREREHEFVKA